MQIDQARSIRSGEELPLEALQAYLSEALALPKDSALRVEQFPSGFSNLTYLLHLGERRLVLRRPPFGAGEISKGHDMEREFNILQRLYPVFPKVPQPYLYCADPALIGAPFYVMERVEGIIPRAGKPLGLPPEALTSLCRHFIQELAQLHQIPLEQSGLLALGKPEGYLQRQVEGWTARYRKAQTEDLPLMEQLIAWLAEHLPESPAPAFLHNDYKFDNLVLAPEDPTRIKAILDWEMATVGDPLAELGLALAYYPEANDAPALLQFSLPLQEGLLRRSELVALYEEQRGLQVSEGQRVYYYVFGLFKIAVIVQQIYYRYKKGYTQDARFAALVHVLQAAVGQAAQSINRGTL